MCWSTIQCFYSSLSFTTPFIIVRSNLVAAGLVLLQINMVLQQILEQERQIYDRKNTILTITAADIKDRSQ